MKLKIGTVEKKKEEVPTITDNYTDDYTDKELEAMSKEANLDPSDSYEEEPLTEEILKEINEIPEDIKKEADEKDIKKAVNDVFVLDEIGINIKYAEKYLELFPNKKIVYQNFITKPFLEWYIKKAKLPLLKELYIKDSEFVKPKQQKELIKKINKRFDEDNKLVEKINKRAKEDGFIEVSEAELNGTSIELETEEQINAYEFLLTEKWKANERAKGIQQLDAIIEEQMRVKGFDLNQALKHVIDGFHLTSKFGIEKKLKKSESTTTPEPKKEEISYSKELSRSIKRFHHIKFLYELMGDDDKFKLVSDLSDEEIEHIRKIKELLEGGSIPKKKKKEVNDHETIAQMEINNFFSGGND